MLIMRKEKMYKNKRLSGYGQTDTTLSNSTIMSGSFILLFVLGGLAFALHTLNKGLKEMLPAK